MACFSGNADAQQYVDNVHTGRQHIHISSDGDVNDSPLWFEALFHQLGVLPGAWAGWAAIHEKPHQVFLICNSLGIFTVLLNTVLLAVLSQPLRWDHHIPTLLNVVCHTASIIMSWRHGPVITKTKTFAALGCVLVFSQAAVATRLMLGPIELVPFQNRLAFVAANAVATWAMGVGGMLGCWAPDHPAEPYRYLLCLAAPMSSQAMLHVCSWCMVGDGKPNTPHIAKPPEQCSVHTPCMDE